MFVYGIKVFNIFTDYCQRFSKQIFPLVTILTLERPISFLSSSLSAILRDGKFLKRFHSIDTSSTTAVGARVSVKPLTIFDGVRIWL